MEIIATSGNLNKREQYNIMKGANNVKCSDLVGVKLHVSGYLIFSRDGRDGQEICGILYETSDGASGVAVTNSRSLTEDVATIASLVDDPTNWYLEIVAGKSRAGRTFLRGNWVE